MKKQVYFIFVFFIVGLCVWFFVQTEAETKSVSSERAISSEITPLNMRATAVGVSPKVSSFAPAVPDNSSGRKTAEQKVREVPNNLPFRKQVENVVPDAERKLAEFSQVPMSAPSLSFEGLNSNDNAAAYGFRVLPPDTFGDVGFNHYVQAVNSLVRVFDKNGNPLTPPFKLSSLFAPLGTACATRNDGDPIVLFDALNDRWLLSQFCTQAPPFRQMIAVSKTGDPTGEYFIYEFVMPNNKLNDYSKFGIWTDAYYMSTDEFIGSDYAGSGVFAFDKSKLLTGDPSASYIYFDLASPTTLRIGGLLPTDLDGLTPPPAGAPNIFVGYTATEYGEPLDAIRLFDFRPDFANPLNSSFTERSESPLAVAAFDPTSPTGRDDISQPSPGEKLDSQSDRLMYRVAYRNFGAFDSLVFNQTVRVTPPDQTYRAGVRLYELRRNLLSVPPVQPFTVREASTLGSNDTSRFMAAAAQDHQGNLAFGFNTSDESKRPSIIYSGKLAAEPLGTFRTEGTLIIGTGVQRAFGFRWGDYSGLSIDPADDCSFWLTNQYYTLESENESDFGWLTRIGKFKFAECTNAPRSTLVGNVTNAATGQPIQGALITASRYSRTTSATGNYGELIVLPNTYELTASAKGFRSQTVTVTISNGQMLTQNFALQPTAVLENAGTQLTIETCGPNQVPEPGESLEISIALRNTGGRDTTNLTATLQATGGVVNPSGAQNYGALAANGASVARPFNFSVDSGLLCGATLTLTLQLQDGAENLGALQINLQTGRRRIAFQENFDAVSAPALPNGWTTSATGVQQNWTTSSEQNQTVPNSVFSPAPNNIGVNELVTPIFNVNAPNAELSFRNWYDLETTFLRNRLYDGSVLEIKIGSGAWQDIEASGGVFLAGGYDGVIDSCCQNPLMGRRGWSGRSGINQTSEFVTSKVKLPPSAVGQNVQLRWRIGTDIGTFRTGQFIDNISVQDEFVCDCEQLPRFAPFDFDGDGKTDLSVFRPSDLPSEADFFIQRSGNNTLSGGAWGSSGDLAVNADYDGDGRADLAIFRPSTGTWFVLQSANGSILTLNFGLAGDNLRPSDYDGDGKADIAVFRPSDGVWYIRQTTNGQTRIQQFGLFGDVPVPADFDGDGRADLAVFRPSEGNWYVFQSLSNAATVTRFGTNGDKPVSGDFDGDGRADFVVFRPSDRVWYQQKTTQGFSAVQFGLSDDKPLQADFDSDGRRDIAVFRPGSGVWYYLRSTDNSFAAVAFGQSNDTAVPSVFVP